MLGGPVVVERARVWVLTATGRERFVREGRVDPEGRRALLERQRTGREGCRAAVRDVLGLAPGHSARRPLAAPGPVPGQR
ncbi:hypothetical protein [Streptomyces sp. NPDC057412]|uniref:hypothetical protein n=1 Tax=Streptomyces sp. NPDC057412 TaxID=3346123 RepID=UPI0036C1AB34